MSVLIGVFASQLAGETFESITEEIEKEQKEKAEAEGDVEVEDGITREVMGMKIPQWLVGFQLKLQEADQRIDEFITIEHQAGVWNYTQHFMPTVPKLSTRTRVLILADPYVMVWC